MERRCEVVMHVVGAHQTMPESNKLPFPENKVPALGLQLTHFVTTVASRLTLAGKPPPDLVDQFLALQVIPALDRAHRMLILCEKPSREGLDTLKDTVSTLQDVLTQHRAASKKNEPHLNELAELLDNIQQLIATRRRPFEATARRHIEMVPPPVVDITQPPISQHDMIFKKQCRSIVEHILASIKTVDRDDSGQYNDRYRDLVNAWKSFQQAVAELRPSALNWEKQVSAMELAFDNLQRTCDATHEQRQGGKPDHPKLQELSLKMSTALQEAYAAQLATAAQPAEAAQPRRNTPH